MSTHVLRTKLYIPPLRPGVVSRPRLVDELNRNLHRTLTLISAPAGFGKTTLMSEWIVGCARPTAWLSLDEADSDPARFLTYVIAALQTVAPDIGNGLLAMLQSPQPVSIDASLTSLLNDLDACPDALVLVLDDYHVIDSDPTDRALGFLIDNLPPWMHLVIGTRMDPQLPLARLRTRGQMSELRAADLRFTPAEATTFLTSGMGLELSATDIAALDDRTEGWVAGLQLAAVSMQGRTDASAFIQSFTGSHRFVLDYLVEEVLHRQPANVQTFLLATSVLDRVCGPLCDAVLRDPATPGQPTLEYLERANLFLVPLDDERRWYRFHHLFAELLRQRLQQGNGTPALEATVPVAEYHSRASVWYEQNDLVIDAFRHAAAANDIERAEFLIEKGLPLHLRGAVIAVLDWLGALPATVMQARPWLWWRYGSLLLVVGQTTGVDEKLQAAEDGMEGMAESDTTRHLIGRIATARSVLALTRYQADTIVTQAHRALEYLPADDLSLRANAHWTLGFAGVLQGDRAAARRAYAEAIALGQQSGAVFTAILATGGLAHVLELDTQLHLAFETHRGILDQAGDQPLPFLSTTHLGLAQILYEWNDLDAAERHGQQSLDLARQFDRAIDRYIVSEVLLARVMLARGDADAAAAMLAQTSDAARQQNFVPRMPEIAAAQVMTLLRLGDLPAATRLVETYDIPFHAARLHLARGNPSDAIAILDRLYQQAESRGWQDVRLKTLALLACARDAAGDTDGAAHALGNALALAEPGGFIRLFVDEGEPMARLVTGAATSGLLSSYHDRLVAAFAAEPAPRKGRTASARASSIDQLSPRELDVLRLIAQGRSNREIGDQLFLALDTVKGHNRKIFGKLGVQRRTEAIARARELGLL